MKPSFRGLRSHGLLSKILIVGIALITGAALTPAARAVVAHPFGTVQESSDPGTLFTVVNSNPTGSGILGQAGVVPYRNIPGAGLIGISNPADNSVGFGLVGLAASGYGVAAGSYGSNPGLYATNYATPGGPAIQAVSANTGVIAQSTASNGVVGTTTATGSAQAGVLGQDLSGGHNSGVVGQTTSGVAGVYGQGTGSSRGVFGISDSAYGVVGFSATGVGVVGQSNSTFGVAAYNASNTQPTLYVKSLATNILAGQPVIIAENGNGVGILLLDQAGNMMISGRYTSIGTSLSVTRSSTGAKVVTYSARQSQPTAEDVGEAQLRNGAAFVHLDSTFAGVMDHRTSYLVFITPQGNTDSFLYVTNKTSSGFEVRESHFGHDNVAFDYRIVAKPYDTSAARLPLYQSAQSMLNSSLRATSPVAPGRLPKIHYSAGRIPRAPKMLPRPHR